MNMKEKYKRTVLVILIIFAICCSIFALRLYFARIDAASKEIMNKNDVAFMTKNNELNSKGFYIANLKEELDDFTDDKVTKIAYEFEGEDFYLDIVVNNGSNNEKSYEIEKIGCPKYEVNARMNMKDIESIEYRTDKLGRSTVLKINEKYNSEYFAMAEGTYYFLGQDIESISYRDEHFYYMTYNPNYKLLDEAETCSKEVKDKIHKFSLKDYYYKYGKINFLSDYYQKLASKTYTVQERCDELAQIQKEKEPNEDAEK